MVTWKSRTWLPETASWAARRPAVWAAWALGARAAAKAAWLEAARTAMYSPTRWPTASRENAKSSSRKAENAHSTRAWADCVDRLRMTYGPGWKRSTVWTERTLTGMDVNG